MEKSGGRYSRCEFVNNHGMQRAYCRQSSAYNRELRWKVYRFEESARECAWDQGPPRTCKPVHVRRNAEVSAKQKPGRGLKDPSWLLKQLVAMFG